MEEGEKVAFFHTSKLLFCHLSTLRRSPNSAVRHQHAAAALPWGAERDRAKYEASERFIYDGRLRLILEEVNIS